MKSRNVQNLFMRFINCSDHCQSYDCFCQSVNRIYNDSIETRERARVKDQIMLTFVEANMAGRAKIRLSLLFMYTAVQMSCERWL